MNLYPFEDAWNGLLMKDEVISQAENWTQIFLKMDAITPDNMVKKKVFKQGKLFYSSEKNNLRN